MKQGRSLEDLLKEVIRQQDSKRDFLAATDHVSLVPKDGDLRLQIGTNQDVVGVEVGVNDVAHDQIGSYTKIPAAYYDRMRQQDPNLLAINVNAWLRNGEPKNRMIRTLDGKARAFLSDHYRALDNVDLLEAALDPLLKMGVKVLSAEVTDRRLYLKVVDQRIARDLRTGVELGRGHDHFDTVSPALVLSNSEVGAGALAVQTSVWTGGCSNLMVIRERSMRKYHLGGRQDIGEEVYRLLSDKTKALTDAAIWSQIQDVVKGAFDVANFDAQVDKLKRATEDKIEGDPVKVVEIASKKLGLTEGERGSVLNHLIRSGDLSRYGLHAAVTRTAEDSPDYDRASELEMVGSDVIELPRRDWQEFIKTARVPEKVAA